MEPLALNPGTYSGSYKLISGELCLDFVNTISFPGTSRSHDWLDPMRNLLIWAESAGIKVSNDLHKLSDKAFEDQMPRIIQIREDLSNVLKPLAFGKRPTTKAFDKLNTLLHEACTNRYINESDYSWRWSTPDSLTVLIAPVIWNAAYVVTELDHSRLGYCGRCHWLFYDTTRNRSRRWCDMEDCGSRDKALRYYHRTKA